jgi:hypothetical protein
VGATVRKHSTFLLAVASASGNIPFFAVAPASGNQMNIEGTTIDLPTAPHSDDRNWCPDILDPSEPARPSRSQSVDVDRYCERSNSLPIV